MTVLFGDIRTWLNTHHEGVSAISDAATACFAFGTFAVLLSTTTLALRQYRESQRQQRILKDLEIRQSVIKDTALSEMQRKVCNRDSALANLLATLNSHDHPCPAGTLTESEEKMRQDLDNYLNFFETIGMLHRRDWFTDDELSGYWKYYAIEADNWDILRTYFRRKEFQWDDLIRVVKIAREGPKLGL